MNYLDPTEYGRFGLGADTPDDLVLAASSMVDGYCRRPTLGIGQYVERLRFRRRSRSVSLSYGPLVVQAPATSALVGVRVRWGYSPSDACVSPFQEIAQAFGVCGSWSAVDPLTIDVAVDGVIEFQANLLLVPFAEAEITYTAGYATVPDAVKAACAQIVRNAQATPALNVRDSRMDTMRLQYFSASLLDEDTQRVLRPFVAQRVG